MLYDYRLIPFAKWFRLKSDHKYRTIKTRFKKRKINYLYCFRKLKNSYLLDTSMQRFKHFNFLPLVNNSYFFIFFFKKLFYNNKNFKHDFFSFFRLFFLKFSFLSKIKTYLGSRNSLFISRLLRKRYRFFKKRFKYYIRFRYFSRFRRKFFIRRKRFLKKRYHLRHKYFYKKKLLLKKRFSTNFLFYRYNIQQNGRLFFYFSNFFSNNLRSFFFFYKKYLLYSLKFSFTFLKNKLLAFLFLCKKKIVFTSLFFYFLKHFRLTFLKNFFFHLNLIFGERYLKTTNVLFLNSLVNFHRNSFFRKLKNVIKNSKMRSKRLFFRFLLNRRFAYREKNKRLFKISYQLAPRFYLIDEFFFNSFLISKFINNLVKKGKKAWARRITYSLFSVLKVKFKMEIIFLFMRLLSLVVFPYDLVNMRRGKIMQESPVLLLASQVVNRTLLIINMNLRSLTNGSLIIKYFTIFNDYFFLQQGFLFLKMSEYIERVDDLRFLTRKKYSYRLLKNFV